MTSQAMKTYKHYGWPVSPYSAKTRAYLRFKGVDFEDIEPGMLRLMQTIRKAVGRPIMPTVLRSDGVWMQDTSEIIDQIEADHPTPATVPAGPRQRVASLLLELHADEWLPTVAMFTRWSIPENKRFAEDEFGRYSFPHMPLPMSRRIARPMAKKMASYLPILGVGEETKPGIDTFLRDLIAKLEAHLGTHPFLLGTRPCIGDFALYGPLWSHCHRDPGSTHYFEAAPSVVDWFERLKRPSADPGAFLDGDQVPETLDPIFETLFAEQWPFIETLVEKIDKWCLENPGAKRVPRSLGNSDFTFGGHAGQRRLITFTQWMAQRPLKAYADLDSEGRAEVDGWLTRVGGQGKLTMAINNPFERKNFKVRLARPAGGQR